jgi:hypothetical protein
MLLISFPGSAFIFSPQIADLNRTIYEKSLISFLTSNKTVLVEPARDFLNRNFSMETFPLLCDIDAADSKKSVTYLKCSEFERS